ncbi:MAG: two component, sigma54 specific, transcriptional regulator, Fis family [Candidatus Angelobacter sp.]|jgi:two-component system nitrogen regulation response regulator NtrX|nr:two component, sigma54 specific, transcriptional regulator, Fis family [Candidatus Angelobacter sp.]
MGATQRAQILIIDDDTNTLASLARAFRLAGHEVTVCDNPNRALEILKTEKFDLIFSDVVMPGKDGLSLLADINAAGVQTPVVMMSGQAHIEMAVRATRLGAIDFLEKPISTEKLLLTVQNAVRISRLEDENQSLRKKLGDTEIIFQGETMRQLMVQVDRVAASESRVCILGETGTGKELIARALHNKSNRGKNDGPFVTLNCAAVPAELIESELFGHEKGSFTGAGARHIGKVEQAHNGTLFLDEIGDMPLNMQAKLLRVLEQNEIERIGGDKPVKVSVRVIVATHQDLESQVQQGTFRRDLFHRIYVFPVMLPALRERPEDIPALVEHFARQIVNQNGWRPAAFASEAVEALCKYSWPGNIRELRNVVERLLLFSVNDSVDLATINKALPSGNSNSASSNLGSFPDQTGTLSVRVEHFERETILAEIKRQQNHITNTAKALGMERSHLYKKCQQLGIDLREARKQ